MSVEEAKDYLVNFEEVSVDEDGSKTTFKYRFYSDEQLTAAAEYISANGLEAFNAIIDNALEEENFKAPDVMPYTADILTDYQTVSGNGIHTVSSYVTGKAYFDRIAATAYNFDFSYKATVKNNEFTTLNSFTVKNFHSAANTTMEDITFNQYVNGRNAGVTVNYKIVRTISVGDPFSVDVIVESDMDSFALLLTLK